MAEELPPCDAAEVKAGKLCARDYYQAVMDHIKAKCNTPESGDVMVSPTTHDVSWIRAQMVACGWLSAAANLGECQLRGMPRDRCVPLCCACHTSPLPGRPRPPPHQIMLNPGRHFAECDFMTKNGVGFVNAFEDTFDTYENFNAKKFIQCPCKDAKSAAGVPVRCVASIHS